MPEGATPLRRTLTVEQEPVTILATGSNTVRCPQAGVVGRVSYTATAAVTGAASPSSRTLSVINKGQSGAGTTVVASLALVSGVNLVAFDEKDITLSATAADRVVTEGDILEFRSAPVGGTGLADPGGTVTVEIERA